MSFRSLSFTLSLKLSLFHSQNKSHLPIGLSLSFSWPLPPSLSLSFKKSIFELYLLTHTYLLPLTIFLLQQVLFLKNRPTPGSSFLFIFVLFKHKFTEKNCRRKKVSNSDRRSRRRACWPLNHHHGPQVLFLACLLFRSSSSDLHLSLSFSLSLFSFICTLSLFFVRLSLS